MPKCAVNGCSSTNHAVDNSIVYHQLPADPTFRAEWRRLTVCTSDGASTQFVCSRHFVDADYEMIWRGKHISLVGSEQVHFGIYLSSETKDWELRTCLISPCLTY